VVATITYQQTFLPKDLEPKYVNDEDGSEIYYHNGHWWLRTIDSNGVVTWRFKIPAVSPDTWGADGYAHPHDGWEIFVPCYGVPLCFEKHGDGTYTPYKFGDIPTDLPAWENPINYPPSFREMPSELDPYYDPYNVPQDRPDSPFQWTKSLSNGKGWRYKNVPAGVDKGGDPYYERGWDPVIGPTIIKPDGIYPANPDFILPRTHPPCKKSGIGIDIPAGVVDITASLEQA
jgi:hypothetical protein